jgi:tetratricopeptide (TPR) repeat protein
VRLRLESPSQSATLYRRGLGVAQAAGSGRAVATALVGLANTHRMRDDYAGARSLLTEAVTIARTPDGASMLPEVLVHLGHVHRQCGNIEASEECLTEAIRLTRRDGDAGLEMYALVGLAWARYATGRDDDAGRAFTRARELAREDGHVAGEAAAELGLGYVLLRRGDPVGATVRFQELEKLADRLGSRNSQFEAVLGTALACREADPARTVELGGQALAIARELEQRADVARTHDVVAGALVQLGDRSGAAEHWDHALKLLADLEVDTVEGGDISVASISRQRALLDDPRPGAAGDEARA